MILLFFLEWRFWVVVRPWRPTGGHFVITKALQSRDQRIIATMISVRKGCRWKMHGCLMPDYSWTHGVLSLLLDTQGFGPPHFFVDKCQFREIRVLSSLWPELRHRSTSTEEVKLVTIMWSPLVDVLNIVLTLCVFHYSVNTQHRLNLLKPFN